MNKREEFVRQLNVLMWYLDPQGVLIPDPLVKKQCCLLNDLYDQANQPSQDGLPELPKTTHYLMRKGIKLAIYDPGQMLAYGAQCRAAGQWIACSERLPPAGVCVIALDNNGVSLMTDFEPSHEDMNGVTHWMPLPAPPLAAAPKGEGK